MKTFLKIVSAATITVAAISPAFAQNTATASSTATGKVISPLTITAGAALAFGTVVKPATGLGPYTITVGTNGSHASSTANSYLPSSPATAAAAFSITGEPNQSTSIAVGTAGHMTMTGPTTGTIDVTLTSSKSTSTLPSGADSFTVGGSFSLPDTQETGDYTGTLTAVVTYN